MCRTAGRRLIKSEVGARAITDLTALVRAAVGRLGRFQGRTDRPARRQQVRHEGVHALPDLHQGSLRVLQGGTGPGRPGTGPQRRGPGRVPGGRRQEGPPHPGPLRRRADRRFAWAWARPGSARSCWRTSPTTAARRPWSSARRRLRAMWERELATATIAAQIVGMEELGRQTFEPTTTADADCILIDEIHNFRNDKANRYLNLDTLIQLNGGRGPGRRAQEGDPAVGHADQQRPLRPGEPDPVVHAGPPRLFPGGRDRRLERLLSPGPADRQGAGHGRRRRPVQPARRGDGPQHPAIHQGGLPKCHNQGPAG